MIRTLHRTRGASAAGATEPGQRGPYGIRPDLDEDDLGDEQHDQDRDDEGTPR